LRRKPLIFLGSSVKQKPKHLWCSFVGPSQHSVVASEKISSQNPVSSTTLRDLLLKLQKFGKRIVAKNKDQKKKERERRVAQKKLTETAKRREVAKKQEDAPTGIPRAKKVLTAGVKQAQITTSKPSVTHRRAGG